MNSKKYYCIIPLLFAAFLTHALSESDRLPGLETNLPELDRLMYSNTFLSPFADESLSTDRGPSVDGASAGTRKDDGLFARIIFSYTIPITYLTLSIINKEILYHDAPGDNYLRYINAPITSVLVFSVGGFFTGLTLGLLLSDKDNSFDMFLYPVIVATLLGISGAIGGGIYALLDYDNIVVNDLFYYGGPVLLLMIPIGDLIATFAED